jgi:hypothetical protein
MYLQVNKDWKTDEISDKASMMASNGRCGSHGEMRIRTGPDKGLHHANPRSLSLGKYHRDKKFKM